MAAGLFVTFEGIEASGKSTQVKLLHDYLATTSLPFVFTREPGGTPLGERLREILSDPHANITAEAETLIFSASRAQLVSDVIVPALRDGKLVVCDRFWDATLAYQGFARGLPVDTIMRITAFAARDLAPDITFLLDIPISIMHERLGGRRRSHDRMEREQDTFHATVAEGYRRLAAAEPDRIVVLDGTRPKEKLADIIRERVLTASKHATAKG